jgi:hypothetical protein
LNIRNLEAYLEQNKERHARIKFVEEKFPSCAPEKELDDTFAMALLFCQKVSKETDLKEACFGLE